MKLNQGLVLAAALVVGSLAVTGCSKSVDEGATDEVSTTEQASVVGDQGGTIQAVASNDEGFTQDARGFRGGRGGRGGERGFRGGFRGGRERGFRGGDRDGWRRGERRAPRAWWRFW